MQPGLTLATQPYRLKHSPASTASVAGLDDQTAYQVDEAVKLSFLASTATKVHSDQTAYTVDGATLSIPASTATKAVQ